MGCASGATRLPSAPQREARVTSIREITLSVTSKSNAGQGALISGRSSLSAEAMRLRIPAARFEYSLTSALLTFTICTVFG